MRDTIRSGFVIRMMLILALVTAGLIGSAGIARAQDASQGQAGATGAADEEAAGTDAAVGPAFRDYKGVRIGTSAAEARQKLGKPESRGDKQDFFLVSDDEMARIFYDKDGRVNAVSVTYTGKSDAAPTAVQALGVDVPAGSDGRVYKLVRYPQAGYWVAYARTKGDTPIVSITMKKLRAAAAR